MSRWPATLWLIAAIVYFIVPWDLDFIPVFGRLDDLFVLALAGYYYLKQTKSPGGKTRRRPTAENAPADPLAAGEQPDADPYQLFGVSRNSDAATIKKAYRDLMAKYHPYRVQHLGEEFKELAASKTTVINKAYEKIKKARSFS